jgi:hypothetical protein
LEATFRNAHDWVNATGVGVKEEHGQAYFEDVVRKRCAHYYELEPIMIDWATSKAVMTSDEFAYIDSNYLDVTDDLKDRKHGANTGNENSLCSSSFHSPSNQSSSQTQSSSAHSNFSYHSPSHHSDDLLDPELPLRAESKSAPKSKKARSGDDDDVEFKAYMKEQQEQTNQRMHETCRHNKAMEKMRQRELQQQSQMMEIQLKKEQVDYDVKIMEAYNKMRFTFEMEYDVIAETMPDAIKFFPLVEREKYGSKKSTGAPNGQDSRKKPAATTVTRPIETINLAFPDSDTEDDSTD